MKKISRYLIELFARFIPKKENAPETKKAVLLIFFNRPNETKKVFEQIRIARPPRLYLASDGARKFIPDEKELVDDLRHWIISNIDWTCEIHTLFREKNIGCGAACSGAITWFFENEPCGLIFEDDCVPCQSFFYFCNELLDKYKNNNKVWGISGNQFDQTLNVRETYIFTRLTHGWGWATWADRWDKFNFNLTGWNNKFIYKFHKAKKVRDFYNYIFDRKKKADGGWAFQMQLLVMRYNGFFVHPSKNLVKNIGFDGATYDNAIADPLLNVPTYDFEKIVHPARVKENEQYLNYQLKIYCDYDAN